MLHVAMDLARVHYKDTQLNHMSYNQVRPTMDTKALASQMAQRRSADVLSTFSWLEEKN